MSNKTWTLNPRENILPTSQFGCSTPNWYDFCTKTGKYSPITSSSFMLHPLVNPWYYIGGVGPAWHFDGQYLYVRVVAPLCYNRNTYTQCNNAYFEQFGTQVYNPKAWKPTWPS
jgi:hypothetical protein